jgi:predicted RNase H-like nuclease (RuvC/YqgF family)
MPHSSDEYRREIRELRGRIFTYVEEITKLRSRIDLLQGEVSALERMVFKQERDT